MQVGCLRVPAGRERWLLEREECEAWEARRRRDTHQHGVERSATPGPIPQCDRALKELKRATVGFSGRVVSAYSLRRTDCRSFRAGSIIVDFPGVPARAPPQAQSFCAFGAAGHSWRSREILAPE